MSNFRLISQNKNISDIILKNDQVVIGRACDADVIISDKSISKKHVKFLKNNEGFWTIYDLSLNGTLVNNVKIEPKKEILLQDQDCISLNKFYNFKFSQDEKLSLHKSKKFKSDSSQDTVNEFSRKSISSLSPNMIKLLAQLKSEIFTKDEVIETLKKENDTKKLKLEEQKFVIEREFKAKHDSLMQEKINALQDLTKNNQNLQNQLADVIKEKLAAESECVEFKEKFANSQALINEQELQIKDLQENKTRLEQSLKLCEQERDFYILQKNQQQQQLEQKKTAFFLDDSNLLGYTSFNNVNNTLSPTKMSLNPVQYRLLNLLERDFQCVICHEILIKPSVLKCSHVFCDYCLTTWLHTKRQCPVCRKQNSQKYPILALENFLNNIFDVNCQACVLNNKNKTTKTPNTNDKEIVILDSQAKTTLDNSEPEATSSKNLNGNNIDQMQHENHNSIFTKEIRQKRCELIESRTERALVETAAAAAAAASVNNPANRGSNRENEQTNAGRDELFSSIYTLFPGLNNDNNSIILYDDMTDTRNDNGRIRGRNNSTENTWRAFLNHLSHHTYMGTNTRHNRNTRPSRRAGNVINTNTANQRGSRLRPNTRLSAREGNNNNINPLDSEIINLGIESQQPSNSNVVEEPIDIADDDVSLITRVTRNANRNNTPHQSNNVINDTIAERVQPRRPLRQNSNNNVPPTSTIDSISSASDTSTAESSSNHSPLSLGSMLNSDMDGSFYEGPWDSYDDFYDYTDNELEMDELNFLESVLANASSNSRHNNNNNNRRRNTRGVSRNVRGNNRNQGLRRRPIGRSTAVNNRANTANRNFSSGNNNNNDRNNAAQRPRRNNIGQRTNRRR